MRYPAKATERLRHELATAYARAHRSPSGKLTVASLTFSANPKKWTLKTTSYRGAMYPGKQKGNFRTDLALSACLSPAWLSDATYFVEYAGKYSKILLGTHSLPPPTWADLCTFYETWAPSTGLQFVRRPSIILTAATCCLDFAVNIRRPFEEELRGICSAFNKHVAKVVAQRLTPSPTAPPPHP